MSEHYEALIEKALPEDLWVGLKLDEGATYGEAIALGQARAAIKGKIEAAREIADRVMSRAKPGNPSSFRPRRGPDRSGGEDRGGLGSEWQKPMITGVQANGGQAEPWRTWSRTPSNERMRQFLQRLALLRPRWLLPTLQSLLLLRMSLL